MKSRKTYGKNETTEILSDQKALKDIAKALKEFERGEYVEL